MEQNIILKIMLNRMEQAHTLKFKFFDQRKLQP